MCKKRGATFKKRKLNYKEKRYSNGETKLELLARGRYLLYKYDNKWSEKEKKRVSIFPILDYKKSEKKYRIITPIISYGRSYKNENKFFNIGGIVFHYNKTKNATRGLFLWPLYEYDFNRNGSSSHSFILNLFERKKE